jgi:NAD+ kinase
MLSNRPIVIDGNSLVEITYTQRYQHEAQITCDNVILSDVQEGDKIVITRAEHPIKLLHPVDHNFYEIARAKLHWSG